MRIALGVEYNGTHFKGWESQPGHRTVQACLEKALSKVANTAIKVIVAASPWDLPYRDATKSANEVISRSLVMRKIRLSSGDAKINNKIGAA